MADHASLPNMPSRPPPPPPSPFTAEDWRTVVTAGYAFLANVAASLATTTYSAFCSAVDAHTTGAHSLDPHAPAVGAALAAIARCSLEEKNVILPAVILTADGIPGTGFFAFAKEVGLLAHKAKSDERFSFWADHVQRVYAAFRQPGSHT